MSLKHLIRHALSLPLHIAVEKAIRYWGRILKSQIDSIADYRRCTYPPNTDEWIPTDGLGWRKGCSLDATRLRALEPGIAFLSHKTIGHTFDLLGSGAVWVGYGMFPKGLSGHDYSKIPGKPGPVGLLPNLSPGNRRRAAAIRNLIDSGYRPIDWQIDFISGYRWREDRISGTLSYGHEPGADIKVPWELGRLQHLAWLAWAYMLADGGSKNFEPSSTYAREFRNQVLDFAAANPPGYGVNWLCTMDVAIRAANLLMAMDLFISAGAEFDSAFLKEFHALIVAHGRHIVEHLEWHDQHRANHYLADVAGLLFVAAYLPRSPETDCWLAFAVRQLLAEVERQFTADGANFEASTSYHRLSSEIAIYASALVLGLSDNKKAALAEYDHGLWTYHPDLPPGPIIVHAIPGGCGTSPFPSWYFERLEKMSEFSMHVTKPNGRVAQIGDNDNGRFFKLCPILSDGREEHLDHRATVAAVNGLFMRPDFAEFTGPGTMAETDLIAALSKGRRPASYLAAEGQPRAVGRTIGAIGPSKAGFAVISDVVIAPPDPSVLKGLSALSYPDFGLYIWRSPRFFMSVRCGPIGQNGNGGHAHNDQLAIELNIDGEDWIADPGTYVYTPLPDRRDSYRSVKAHAAPRVDNGEPARLDLGLFRLEDRALAKCLFFGATWFEGMHVGYGVELHRRITIEKEAIHIFDTSSDLRRMPENIGSPYVFNDGASLRAHWNLDLPFSSGYGMLG